MKKILMVFLMLFFKVSFPVCADAMFINFPTGFNMEKAVSETSSLYFFSQGSDYIGQGREWYYGVEDGDFSVQSNYSNFNYGVAFNFTNHNYVDFRDPNHVHWDARFEDSNEQWLTKGIYNNATRFPFNDFGVPGLSVSGDGRGCNRLGGRFEVVDIDYKPNGVQTFDALFEQHCEDETASSFSALYGRVRFNADVSGPVVPEPSTMILFGFGLAGAVVRKTFIG